MGDQEVTLCISNNAKVVGTLPNQKEGLVALYVDDQELTHVPINYDATTNSGIFEFQTSVSLVNALPDDYEFAAQLPCGTRITLPERNPFGVGDGSLLQKMASGFVVSAKAGYLYQPPSSRDVWRKRIFESYRSAHKIMAQIPDISELYVAYGILLGLIREGDFISYDDDFDAAYLVYANTPAEAATHFHRVFNHLKDLGYRVSYGAHIGNFHLRLPDLPVIDIFMMYYREQTKELCGFNIVCECESSIITPLQHGKLVGQEVLIPNQPEPLLEAIYGPSWKVPDRYFQWRPSARHKKLNQAYQAASRAIVAGEEAPPFSDEKLGPLDASSS